MSFYLSGNVRDLFYFEKPVANVAGRYILTEVCFSLVSNDPLKSGLETEQ